MRNKEIDLGPERIYRFLLATIGLVVLLSTASVIADGLASHDSVVAHKLMKLFYVDLEENVPSFFSTLLLALASGVLFLVAFLKRRDKDRYAAEWMILALGFLAMSFDEMAAVHERLIEPMRELLGDGQLGIFYFAWVIPMGLLVLILGVLLFGFWWNLPLRTKIGFFVAGSIFLGGSLGFELLESVQTEKFGMDTPAYVAMVTIEEAMEMVGIAFFVKTLIIYAYETYGEVELKVFSAAAVKSPEALGERI